jgi:hypothetical protein
MQDSEDEEELPDYPWWETIPVEIKVSRRDWEMIIDALDNPPPLPPKLVEAMASYRGTEKKNVR